MAFTLVIVDDHVEFRRLVSTLLSADGFDVTGEAGDGEQALVVAQTLRPDIVLVDIQLPGIDGFEVARRLAAAPDAPCIVLTSSRDKSQYGTRLKRAPVRGFIAKQDLSAAALSALVAAR